MFAGSMFCSGIYCIIRDATFLEIFKKLFVAGMSERVRKGTEN